MLVGRRNPILRSILEPEVELMVFLRMRSNTSNFQCIHVCWYEESEIGVHFETGSRIDGVSAHAQ